MPPAVSNRNSDFPCQIFCSVMCRTAWRRGPGGERRQTSINTKQLCSSTYFSCLTRSAPAVQMQRHPSKGAVVETTCFHWLRAVVVGRKQVYNGVFVFPASADDDLCRLEYRLAPPCGLACNLNTRTRLRGESAPLSHTTDIRTCTAGVMHLTDDGQANDDRH